MEEEANSALSSIIECVSAAGTYTRPLGVFNGEMRAKCMVPA